MTKMQKYYEDFAKDNIKSKEHLTSFVSAPSTIAKFTTDELTELMNIWHNGSIEPDYASMTKDGIEEVVLEKHDVDLDKRYKKSTLVKQAEDLDDNQ